MPSRPRLPPSETASALALAVALALHAPMNLFLQPREPQAKPLASASALATDMASPPLAPAKAEALADAAASHSLGRGARRLPLLKSSRKVLTVALASAVADAPAQAMGAAQTVSHSYSFRQRMREGTASSPFYMLSAWASTHMYTCLRKHACTGMQHLHQSLLTVCKQLSVLCACC
jgi:hypothetical protein